MLCKDSQLTAEESADWLAPQGPYPLYSSSRVESSEPQFSYSVSTPKGSSVALPVQIGPLPLTCPVAPDPVALASHVCAMFLQHSQGLPLLLQQVHSAPVWICMQHHVDTTEVLVKHVI